MKLEAGNIVWLAAFEDQPREKAFVEYVGKTTAIVLVTPHHRGDDGIREVEFDQIESVVAK